MNSEESILPDGAWWRTMFSREWALVQSQLKSERDTEREARFVMDALSPPTGSRILDVPCGDGRLTVAFAQKGLKATGVDANGYILNLAAERAQRAPAAVEFVQMDMREIGTLGTFDFIVCFWGSFGYFDHSGDRNFLSAAVRCLSPTGRLLIETHCLETLLPRFVHRQWRHAGGYYLIEERRFEPATSRVITDYTAIGEGIHYQTQSSIRIYSVRELFEFLTSVGCVLSL